MIASNPPARTSIVRTLLLFTPLLAMVLVILALIAISGRDDGFGAGVIVGLTVVGLVALLLAYQVVQSVRDLLGEPVERDGRVERAWSRNEYLLFRNSYIFVNGNVFRLSPEQDVEVELGDTVRIRHYPHTATVVAIEVLERAPSRSRVGDG